MRIERFLLLVGLLAPGAAAAQTRAFVDARIIDGTGAAPIERGVLVVRDGRILAVGPAGSVSIPEGAERMALAGRTIIPGLINTHGHVGQTVGLRSGPEFHTEANVLADLRLYARYGVTTVWGLGGDEEAGFRVRHGQDGAGLDRARLFVAGPVVTAADAEAARQAVRALAARGADIVKIRVDDNLGTTARMPAEVYRAVIDEAHARGLRVAAHVFYLEDTRALLEAGVDFIAHSVRDREVTAELAAQLKERQVCLCPTLTRELSTYVYAEPPGFFEDPFFLREADAAVLEQLRRPEVQQRYRTAAARAYRAAQPVAAGNLKRLADAGVRIAMGTDSGMPARFQGYFEHLEMEMMAEAGLTPMQILVSATGDAARCMKMGDAGVLRAGARADFVVLERDPLQDIRHTRSIESVWIGGNRVPGKR